MKGLTKHFISLFAAFYIIVASAICISLLLQNEYTSGWGVLIMLYIPIYYLTKAKE
jgi:APA family basic amino acid/polyamine antiporter